MDQYITQYPSTYMIYGSGIHMGKSTIVRELINQIDSKYVYAVTSSPEDYKGYITSHDYNIEELNYWIENIPVEKILVLDDFMHINTERGDIADHLKSLMSTSRKDGSNVWIIISSHYFNCGKHIRKLTGTWIFLTIDEDNEVFAKKKIGTSIHKIEQINNLIRDTKYTFLIFNAYRQWSVMRLTQ